MGAPGGGGPLIRGGGSPGGIPIGGRAPFIPGIPGGRAPGGPGGGPGLRVLDCDSNCAKAAWKVKTKYGIKSFPNSCALVCNRRKVEN